MRKAPVRIVDLDPREIEAALAQAKTALPEPTYRILATVVEAYRFILEQLARNRASIGRLRRMLFGPKSEKTCELLRPNEAHGGSPSSSGPPLGPPPKSAGLRDTAATARPTTPRPRQWRCRTKSSMRETIVPTAARGRSMSKASRESWCA